jgi:hypothetical protein
MKKIYSKIYKPGGKKVSGYLVLTIFIFLFTHSCHFLYDGVGTSRVSGYWEDYNGHMSYTEIPARITVNSINENPAETYSWEVLQFGCKLDNKQELIADVEAAGIPTEDIQTIFYNPDRFDGLKLEPGKTYFVKLDIHANYYSYLFKSQYGFAIYTWQELNDGEVGPVIEPYPGWKGKFMLYALACWLQAGLLFPAAFFVYDAQNGSREVKSYAAWLSTLYAFSTFWIVYVDQPFYTNWADYLLQGIGLAISLAMIVYTFIAFQKPNVEEVPPVV